MAVKDEVLKIARIKKQLKSSDIVNAFKISRQYAMVLINGLVLDGKLLKVGSTKKAYYILPDYAKQDGVFPPRITKRLINKDLHEHEVYLEIEKQYPLIQQLPENIRSILNYAFSEMLNNAIEHSKSKNIEIEISIQNRKLSFVVNDFGIGVFRNIMKKKRLKTEVEAMQDLLKGKTTTIPRSHSGEGIFFTSKIADVFTLGSFGHLLVANNKVNEIFFQTPPALKRGTRVKFTIDTHSPKHLNDIFRKFTTEKEYGFNKTEIKVRLYVIGGVHISRSQARRILTGLDKFQSIVLDFDKVNMIGQAFAD
ncbi:MAG: ATP-binding protein [Patescibacteria group bacterium]